MFISSPVKHAPAAMSPLPIAEEDVTFLTSPKSGLSSISYVDPPPPASEVYLNISRDLPPPKSHSCATTAGIGNAPSYVYLLRDACTCIPDFFLNFCFRKARLRGCDASYVRVRKSARKDVIEEGVGGVASSLDASADEATEEAEPVEAPVVDEFRVFKLIFLIGLTTLAGVLNNIFFVSMSIKMPGYPSFLLYFTTVLYVIIYFVWLYLKRRWQRAAVTQPSPAYPSYVGGAATEMTPLVPPQSSATTGPAATVASEETPLLHAAVHAFDKSIDLIDKPVDALALPVASGTNASAASAASADVSASPFGSLPPALRWGYALVGVLITVGGACSQFADAHVTGSLQAVINQLTLPLTAYFAHLLLGHRFSRLEVLGAALVLGASALPLLAQMLSDPLELAGAAAKQMNKPFWVLIFLLSDIPSALTNVLEERLFRQHHVDEIHFLAFTNLFTLFGFLGMIPLDRITPDQHPALAAMSAIDIQINAFQCFLGASPLPPACRPHAWVPVIGFVVCIVLLFYLSAVVIKHESAAFQALANTLVTPLSAVAFSSAAIIDPAYVHPLDIPTVLAILLIPAGIVVYKWEELTGQAKDDIITLIAPH